MPLLPPAQAESRWREIVAASPDLEPAVRLQRTLLSCVFELQPALDAALAEWPAPSAAAASRLAQGVPVLRGARVPLPVTRLKTALLELCAALEAAGAGGAARHVREAVERGAIDAGSLFAASLAREERAIRAKAQHLGLAPDLLWLVAELAVGPAACAARKRIFGTSDACRALAIWARGFCPACGSWPALAELADGRRTLCCSFCGATWQPPTRACIYCGGDGETFVTAIPRPEQPGRRLELCAGCGGYLKQLDLPALTPFPLAAIEDLASADLDVTAMDQGYARPRLPEIGLALDRSSRTGC